MYKIFEQPFDYNTLDHNVVLIDVLRAATVANVVISKKPVVYYMSSNDDEIDIIKQKNIFVVYPLVGYAVDGVTGCLWSI